jgi:hypothetical protein
MTGPVEQSAQRRARRAAEARERADRARERAEEARERLADLRANRGVLPDDDKPMGSAELDRAEALKDERMAND